MTYSGCAATSGSGGAAVWLPYVLVSPLLVQSITLEISEEEGVGHVDGGVHSPAAHEKVNEVGVQTLVFLATSASASRRAASAA